MKPRDQWDREDMLDYLDGWHSGCGLGFKSERDGKRPTHWKARDGSNVYSTNGLMLHGHADRIRHREATGL